MSTWNPEKVTTHVHMNPRKQPDPKHSRGGTEQRDVLCISNPIPIAVGTGAQGEAVTGGQISTGQRQLCIHVQPDLRGARPRQFHDRHHIGTTGTGIGTGPAVIATGHEKTDFRRRVCLVQSQGQGGRGFGGGGRRQRVPTPLPPSGDNIPYVVGTRACTARLDHFDGDMVVQAKPTERKRGGISFDHFVDVHTGDLGGGGGNGQPTVLVRWCAFAVADQEAHQGVGTSCKQRRNHQRKNNGGL